MHTMYVGEWRGWSRVRQKETSISTRVQVELSWRNPKACAGAFIEYFFSKDVDCIVTDHMPSTKVNATGGLTGIFTSAKKFSIRVVYVHAIQALAHSLNLQSNLKQCRVTKLKPPFLKVENMSRKYKPLVYKPKSQQWPQVVHTVHTSAVSMHVLL